MNSKSKYVQLVLSTLVFIALLDALLHASRCRLTTRFLVHAFLSRFYRYTCVCLSTPFCFILRTRWFFFLTTNEPACQDLGAWSLWTSHCWSECIAVSR